MMRKMIDRILEHPLVYGAWQAPFAEQKFRPVSDRLAQLQVQRVLDVGCGPGTNAPRFAGADYVGLDVNEHYLSVARARHRGTFIRADLESADLSSLGTFDTILINSVLHHLPDQSVNSVMRQVAMRLAPAGLVHVLELVRPPQPSVASIMARLDRGRFARPLNAWHELLQAHLEPVIVEPYSFGGGLWEMVYFQGQLRS